MNKLKKLRHIYSSKWPGVNSSGTLEPGRPLFWAYYEVVGLLFATTFSRSTAGVFGSPQGNESNGWRSRQPRKLAPEVSLAKPRGIPNIPSREMAWDIQYKNWNQVVMGIGDDIDVEENITILLGAFLRLSARRIWSVNFYVMSK